MKGPFLENSVEWRTPIWAPAVSSALERAAVMLAPTAKVLEIGYGSGMMSCYMAARYGWNIVGYDIDPSSRIRATETARYYGLQETTDFRICLPDDTLSINGTYDAVFLKSVMYHISDKDLYRNWLTWLHSVVKDGGLVIAVENGKGGLLDKAYRKIIKRSRWANFLLFDRWTAEQFRIFSHVDIKYFGRFSQFLTPFPQVCNFIRLLENKFFPPNAEHCFVASIVAQK